MLGRGAAKEYDKLLADRVSTVIAWVEDGPNFAGWTVYPEDEVEDDAFWLGQWLTQKEAVAYAEKHDLKYLVIPRRSK